MKVLYAVAELAPFVKVGGLGDAAAGLVGSLMRDEGLDVTVALPDYGNLPLVESSRELLGVPEWAAPATARHGSLGNFDVSVIHVPSMSRPHPYQDESGQGWADNDRRFLAFSAAVGELVRRHRPDVLHLNDWHSAAVPGFLASPPPTLLTIHNLAYQGVSTGSWLDRITRRPEAYEWYGGTNPLAGGIALADRIVTVSPTYASEIVTPENGFGLDGALRSRGERLTGVLNGLDTDLWDPAADPLLTYHFSAGQPAGRWRARRDLLRHLRWEPDDRPLVGMVSRLTHQKGVDLALDAFRTVDPTRMVLLGAGERSLADRARRLARSMSDRFAFVSGYDEALAHRIFGGSDLYLMPSRFEPCGLAQMQAMRYGAIPVVTDVGGLHDTVVDADEVPTAGTGFVAAEPTAASVADACQRAIRAWRSTRRRGAIRRRAMAADWSWAASASRYHALYKEVVSEAR